jgi:hydroxymethylglutaryl-CoA lyase
MSPASATFPAAMTVREVGLRDGLQSIATIVPTAQKCEWIAAAVAAGLREIEVGSFVPPKLLPQLADTAEVLAYAKSIPGLLASVLVPNLRGAEQALSCEADLILVPLSASHAHSLANVRKTPEDMVLEVGRMRAARDSAHSAALIEVTISTAFGCTMQGEVEASDVLHLVQSVLDAGADRVGLADTVGYANPAQVSRLFEQTLKVAGSALCCGHFHDTRGLALANVLAAMALGIHRFDASLAGIGGCPFAPAASGNVATEDLTFMLEAMGHSTGIHLQALLALRERVVGWMPNEVTHGSIWRAGVPKTFSTASL